MPTFLINLHGLDSRLHFVALKLLHSLYGPRLKHLFPLGKYLKIRMVCLAFHKFSLSILARLNVLRLRSIDDIAFLSEHFCVAHWVQFLFSHCDLLTLLVCMYVAKLNFLGELVDPARQNTVIVVEASFAFLLIFCALTVCFLILLNYV